MDGVMDPAEEPPTTFLKADEVDEAGPIGLDLSQQQQLPQDVSASGLDTIEQQHQQQQQANASDGLPQQSRSPIQMRPSLHRDRFAPAPQQPPPPAPPRPADDVDAATDSLSLMELKKLVADMPKSEPASYAFTYEDCSNFEEELEELFSYSAEERNTLLHAQSAFGTRWTRHSTPAAHPSHSLDSTPRRWLASTDAEKTSFLNALADDIKANDQKSRVQSVQSLLYIALGCWRETSGPVSGNDGASEADSPSEQSDHQSRYRDSQKQIQTIKENLRLIAGGDGVQVVYHALQDACFRAESDDDVGEDEEPNKRENDCSYRDTLHSERSELQTKTQSVGQSLLQFLTSLLADMRWNESGIYPQQKVLLLYWKAILLNFGGLKTVAKIKTALGEEDSRSHAEALQPEITASPLDYHLFRQEITSKYPAFDPPPPLFPFEPENTSMVPPPQDIAEKAASAGPSNVDGQNPSIFHQPVHISTPAPSPPPSPAGPGGKGIKKQNYQTNQLFPFVYPPLDAASNEIGGKGSTALQDALVGRKWEGSDIPTSILEAADIFSKRMRATRAMKQLWEERVAFLKFERGYQKMNGTELRDQQDSKVSKHTEGDDDRPEHRLDSDLKTRLDAVEEFYESALPRLQSVVIVLLKILLDTVTTFVTQPNAHNGMANGVGEANGPGRPDGALDDQSKTSESFLLSLDTIRSQEIMGKAVSGILILLMKWFKLSHILKFEYLSQLLLDSNFVQLIFKLFTHQELERVVNYRCEKETLNFFNFCRRHARTGHTSSAGTATDDEAAVESDDAAPPPITQDRPHHRTKHSTDKTDGSTTEPASNTNVTDSSNSQNALPPANPAPRHQPPEVDELGFPISELPAHPITNYSWRNLFTSINQLRTLQKLAKHKTHRQLLMMQYKFSNILKKSLKVPQPDVRLYTLKIIKGQVPYCHRKWRQGNMRIITAIYLHCKPELRDDWLAGLDLDHEMGEAMPLEQAMRSLCWWYNLRRYPEAMGRPTKANEGGEGNDAVGDATSRDLGGQGDMDSSGADARVDMEEMRKNLGPGLNEEEQDFFARELEALDAAAARAAGTNGHGEVMGESEDFAAHGSGLDAGMQMEGW